MTDKYILDAEGNPVAEPDLMKWATWFETSRDVRRVGLDVVGDSKVSTVFLGIDHAFDEATPQLFETMVFGGPLDQEEERYATREQAVAGHASYVARVRATAAQQERPALPSNAEPMCGAK